VNRAEFMAAQEFEKLTLAKPEEIGSWFAD
jgi:hypothetical protein